MSRWRLTCLICGHQDPGLVAIQEHAMREHGYTQEDHREATRRMVERGYRWTFPDGVEWLEAVHEFLVG